MAGALRILVVEDEPVVAMLLEDLLVDLGHRIAAVTGRMEPALEAARDLDLDLAVLDVNLGGERSDGIVAVLMQRGVPIVFATGYGVAGVPPEWRGAPTLQKPFQPEALAQAIEQALAAKA